jgi:hypothetical protein
MINIGFFGLFMFNGITSCFYLFVRFCRGKSIIANLKNIFVIRHFIYVLLYITCHMPIKINEIILLLGGEAGHVRASFLVHLSMGFVMFLIRASETNFYKIICCNKTDLRSSLNNTVNSSEVIFA